MHTRVVVVVVVVVSFSSEKAPHDYAIRPKLRIFNLVHVRLFYTKAEALEMMMLTHWLKLNHMHSQIRDSFFSLLQ